MWAATDLSRAWPLCFIYDWFVQPISQSQAEKGGQCLCHPWKKKFDLQHIAEYDVHQMGFRRGYIQWCMPVYALHYKTDANTTLMVLLPQLYFSKYTSLDLAAKHLNLCLNRPSNFHEKGFFILTFISSSFVHEVSCKLYSGLNNADLSCRW